MACAIQRDQIAGVKPFCFASRAIKASCLIAIVVVLALFGQVAEAEDFLTYWQGPSHGDWNDPLNWTNGLPTASRAACISNGAYADVISGVAVADLVSIEDGGLRLNGTGQLDTGLLTVAKDSSSIFDLGDSATLNCSSLTVGTTAVGLFNQTGGINTITGALALSTRNGSADSTYNLSAGQLSEQSLALSATPHGRTAYFNQSGGTHHVTGDMTMVRNSRYTLSGGQFAVDGKVAIHGGTLAWYGGTLTTPEISFFGGSSYLLLGTSIDFYQLAGGVLPNGTVLTDFQYACIGVGDGSTMTHDTGVVSMGRDFLLGTAAGSYTLNVTGTAGLQTGHYVHVGFEGSGVLNLSDSTQLTTEQVHVGTDVVGSISPGHDGVVNQTGGTVEASNLLVKRGPTDGSPAYHLSGTGQLTTTGYSMIGSGTSPNPNTSTSPVATHEALFRQSGGQHTTDRLYVGRTSSNTIGAYELTGGELVAGEISVGHPSYSPFQSFPGSVGRFSQSGGVVTAGTLTVNSVSRYEFTGGTCQFDDATISGEFDFLGSSALLIFADGIMNFSQGSILNGSNASIDAGNTLFISPTGFDPYSDLGGFTTDGVVHTAGTTLVVPTGKLIIGGGEIDDQVECQGGLTARSGGGLTLNSGLFVSNGGTVNLGAGELIVKDQTSGISDGSLSATEATVGLLPGPASQFTQAGGTVTLGTLMLGDFENTNATYELKGGQLAVTGLSVCRIGHATFSQSGGTLSVDEDFNVLDTYELSGGSIVCGDLVVQDVANEFEPEYSRSGKFVHSGGTLSANGRYGIIVGTEGNTPIYELSGTGHLSTTGLLLRGKFEQTGGSVAVSGQLSIIEPSSYGGAGHIC